MRGWRRERGGIRCWHFCDLTSGVSSWCSHCTCVPNQLLRSVPCQQYRILLGCGHEEPAYVGDCCRTDHKDSKVMVLSNARIVQYLLVQETRNCSSLRLCLNAESHVKQAFKRVSHSSGWQLSCTNHPSNAGLRSHFFPVKFNNGRLKDSIVLDMCLPGCMFFGVLLSHILFSSLWISQF